MHKLRMKFTCDQDWSEMSPTKKGKFCEHCKRTVTDFTQMDRNQVAKKLQYSKGNICGRFSPKQLNDLYFKPQKNNQLRVPTSKIAAGLLIASSVTTHVSCDENAKVINKTELQDKSLTQNSESQTTVKTEGKKDSRKAVPKNSLLLQGKILSEKDNSVAAKAKVSFVTLDKIYSTFCDENGVFSLPIPKNQLNKKNVLYASFSLTNELRKEKNGFTFLLDNSFTFYESQMQDFTVFIASEEGYSLGWPDYYPEVQQPYILKNGEVFSVENYEKFHKTNGFMCGSYAFENEYILNPEQAEILVGEKGENGLILMEMAEEIL